MLTDARMSTTLPVVDMDRARWFYEQTLGLTCEGRTAEGVLRFACNGGTLELYPRDAPPRADHTSVTFEVADVRRMVDALTERGVRFRDYDLGEIRTEDKVATLGTHKAAWFEDPDGNVLCLHQRE